MRNKVVFKQFNPNKSAKYGLLLKASMCRVILIHLFQSRTAESLLEKQLKKLNMVPLK